jgi:hypothetical protein
MPHYYFDVRNGRRHKESLGLDCPDDRGAIDPDRDRYASAQSPVCHCSERRRR